MQVYSSLDDHACALYCHVGFCGLETQGYRHGLGGPYGGAGRFNGVAYPRCAWLVSALIEGDRRSGNCRKVWQVEPGER